MKLAPRVHGRARHHRMEHNASTAKARSSSLCHGRVGSIAINMLPAGAMKSSPSAASPRPTITCASSVPRGSCGARKSTSAPSRWRRSCGPGHRQRRRRAADLAHAHRGPVGNIASIGLGQRRSQHDSDAVHPAGLNLLGINSRPRCARRGSCLESHRTDLRPTKLDRICTRVVPFAELPAQFDDYLKGRVTGRTVVKIA